MNDISIDGKGSSGPFHPLRTWPLFALLPAALALWLIPRALEDVPFWLQVTSALGPAACGLVLILWWLLLSRATWKERAIGFFGVSVAITLSVLLLDKSMGAPGVFFLAFPLGMIASSVSTSDANPQGPPL